jgi:hypothetical protein
MSKRPNTIITMPKLSRKPRYARGESTRSLAWTLSRLEDAWPKLVRASFTSVGNEADLVQIALADEQGVCSGYV